MVELEGAVSSGRPEAMIEKEIQACSHLPRAYLFGSVDIEQYSVILGEKKRLN